MARADRVPLLPGQPPFAFVRAMLNEAVDVVLVVDTGAVRTLISRGVAALLGLDLARPLRFRSLSGVGRSPPVPVVRLNRLRVGGSAVADLEIVVYDLPATLRVDGVLGLDFLRRFRVTFAFDIGELVLRQPGP